MLRQKTKNFLEKSLISSGLTDGLIERIEAVYGGSVNSTYAVYTNSRNFFVKVNSKDAFPEMFQKEQKGLELLQKNSELKIPTVHKLDEFEDKAFLIMELIEGSKKKKNYWEIFGAEIARLHRNTNSSYGLAYNNYNGSLIQNNSQNENWITFFIENRLKFQEKIGVDSKRIDSELSELLKRLYSKIPDILIEEQPALLHGDFWSGNFMVAEDGSPVIMDPAVYFGNREVDIAMSMLFGGFDKDFYNSYNKEFPLQKGWEQRVEVYNIYPLLVHVNLFGSSYAQRVKSILKRLV